MKFLVVTLFLMGFSVFAPKNQAGCLVLESSSNGSDNDRPSGLFFYLPGAAIPQIQKNFILRVKLPTSHRFESVGPGTNAVLPESRYFEAVRLPWISEGFQLGGDGLFGLSAEKKYH